MGGMGTISYDYARVAVCGTVGSTVAVFIHFIVKFVGFEGIRGIHPMLRKFGTRFYSEGDLIRVTCRDDESSL
jgi:hypothetical protein